LTARGASAAAPVARLLAFFVVAQVAGGGHLLYRPIIVGIGRN
jgi:hypothetical protein